MMIDRLLRWISRPNLNIFDFLVCGILVPVIPRLYDYTLIGFAVGILILIVGMIISVRLERKYDH